MKNSDTYIFWSFGNGLSVFRSDWTNSHTLYDCPEVISEALEAKQNHALEKSDY